MRQKIENLKALTEHPGTPEHERENALRRIAEIEAKERKKVEQAELEGMSPAMARMVSRIHRRGRSGLKKMINDFQRVAEEWTE